MSEAVDTQNRALFKEALRLGVSVHGMDKQGNNLLHRTCQQNKIDREIFEILLDRLGKAGMEQRNIAGKTPLELTNKETPKCMYSDYLKEQETLRKQKEETLKKLEDELRKEQEQSRRQEKATGSSAFQKPAFPARSEKFPLHDVIQNFSPVREPVEHEMELILLFLEHMLSLDDEENTPLHIAAKNGDLLACSLLIENGLDIDAVNEDGQTALHIAVANGKSQVVEFLLRNQANPAAKDNSGNTPLDLHKARARHSGHILDAFALAALGRGAALVHLSQGLQAETHSAAQPEQQPEKNQEQEQEQKQDKGKNKVAKF